MYGSGKPGQEYCSIAQDRVGSHRCGRIQRQINLSGVLGRIGRHPCGSRLYRHEPDRDIGIRHASQSNWFSAMA